MRQAATNLIVVMKVSIKFLPKNAEKSENKENGEEQTDGETKKDNEEDAAKDSEDGDKKDEKGKFVNFQQIQEHHHCFAMCTLKRRIKPML